MWATALFNEMYLTCMRGAAVHPSSIFDLPSDRHSSELLRLSAAGQSQTIPLLQVKHCHKVASAASTPARRFSKTQQPKLNPRKRATAVR